MSGKQCCDYEGSKQKCYVSQLSGSVSPVVEECLSHIIEKEGFIYYDVNVRDINTNGGNYLGMLQEIDLKGKCVNGNKEINLFLKNRMVSDDYSIIPLNEVYNREAFYYNELVKIYKKLQDDANISEEDRLRTAKSYDESNSDVTILDNLSKKGYTTCDRLELPTLEFAQKSIKELAKFHGMSFVLKTKMPKFFEKKVLPIKSVMNLNSEFESYFKKLYNRALTHLDGDYRRKMENFAPQMIQGLSEYVNVSDDAAICLCHGDFRPNNILVLKKGGKVEDVIPVDYQLINCGKPASDFLYFIFTGTDQAFRVAHLDGLKELYYNTLETFLKYFDISASEVYTKKGFEDDFNEHLNYGFAMGLILIPFIFPNDENIPEVKDLAELEFEWNNLAIKRWRDMVEFFFTCKDI